MFFKATIQDGCSIGLYLKIPFDVYARYGCYRLKVWVEIENLRFPAVFQRVGRPEYVLVFRKEIREALGLKTGQQVRVRFELRR